MTCEMCGIDPAMPNHRICELCEKNLPGLCADYGLLLESPKLADGGVLVRQVCIAGCEDKPPAQVHMLETE